MAASAATAPRRIARSRFFFFPHRPILRISSTVAVKVPDFRSYVRARASASKLRCSGWEIFESGDEPFRAQRESRYPSASRAYRERGVASIPRIDPERVSVFSRSILSLSFAFASRDGSFVLDPAEPLPRLFCLRRNLRSYLFSFFHSIKRFIDEQTLDLRSNRRPLSSTIPFSIPLRAHRRLPVHHELFILALSFCLFTSVSVPLAYTLLSQRYARSTALAGPHPRSIRGERSF